MILIRSFKRAILIFPLALAILAFTTQIWEPSFLITHPKFAGYVEKTEVIVPLILVLLCSFILPDTNEIELAIVCGVSTEKLFLYKSLPIYLCTLLPSYVILVLYKYIPYDGPAPQWIPIYVPENFKFYLAISLFVSITFFFVLFCFIRVITRNCYAPLFICMFLGTFFSMTSKDIQKGIYDIKFCFIDPFISSYMLGNEVPNAMAEQYVDLTVLKNAWTYNRLIFLGITIVLLVVTCLLLRREKLHKGFGD